MEQNRQHDCISTLLSLFFRNVDRSFPLNQSASGLNQVYVFWSNELAQLPAGKLPRYFFQGPQFAVVDPPPRQVCGHILIKYSLLSVLFEIWNLTSVNRREAPSS